MFFNICSCRIINPYNTEGWDCKSQPTSNPIFVSKERHIRKDGQNRLCYNYVKSDGWKMHFFYLGKKKQVHPDMFLKTQH